MMAMGVQRHMGAAKLFSSSPREGKRAPETAPQCAARAQARRGNSLLRITVLPHLSPPPAFLPLPYPLLELASVVRSRRGPFCTAQRVRGARQLPASGVTSA